MAAGPGGLWRAQTCPDHPHCEAIDRCDACRRRWCEDCFVRGRAQLLCRSCWDEAERREAARTGALGSLVAAVVGTWRGRPTATLVTLGVLGLLGTAAYAGFNSLARERATGEVVRGVQVGSEVRQENVEFAFELLRKNCERTRARGCEDLLNPPPPVCARPETIVQIARVVPNDASAGAGPGATFAAQNLLSNGGSIAPGWRSPGPALPQELTFELRASNLVDQIALRQTQASAPRTWAREVELELSDGAPAGAFHSAGHWTLAQTTDPQQFAFPPMRARYARLRILSRHGDGEYASLGALALGARTGDPGPLLTR